MWIRDLWWWPTSQKSSPNPLLRGWLWPIIDSSQSLLPSPGSPINSRLRDDDFLILVGDDVKTISTSLTWAAPILTMLDDLWHQGITFDLVDDIWPLMIFDLEDDIWTLLMIFDLEDYMSLLQLTSDLEDDSWTLLMIFDLEDYIWPRGWHFTFADDIWPRGWPLTFVDLDYLLEILHDEGCSRRVPRINSTADWLWPIHWFISEPPSKIRTTIFYTSFPWWWFN